MVAEKAVLVIGLAIAGAIALPFLIYFAFRGGARSQMIEMTRRASQRAKNPWREEKASLSELNRLVKQLPVNEPGTQDTGQFDGKIDEGSPARREPPHDR